MGYTIFRHTHLLGEFWQLPEEVQVPEENLQDLILPSWTPGHTATAMVSLRASFATWNDLKDPQDAQEQESLGPRVLGFWWLMQLSDLSDDPLWVLSCFLKPSAVSSMPTSLANGPNGPMGQAPRLCWRWHSKEPASHHRKGAGVVRTAGLQCSDPS